MDNHVHFIAVPERSDSLARAFGEAHRRYTLMINQREGWTGYLWQGRFASFPLDERHAYAAIRYVERNPVEAGLVSRAEDYPWSSARAHVKRMNDPLLVKHVTVDHIQDWAEFLGGPVGEVGEQLEHHSRTGRPLGDREFLERLEQVTGRRFLKQQPGRKRK